MRHIHPATEGVLVPLSTHLLSGLKTEMGFVRGENLPVSIVVLLYVRIV